MDFVRIDKWLWAMRFYKTRTQASQACDLNRISILDQPVKPSRHLRVGDKVEIKWSGGLVRTIEVLQLTERRLGAKLVAEYYKDHTPQKEIDDYKARVARAAAYRDPGSGRPTKKDRRDMDDFLDAVDDLFE
jgi:ribosome-associated heat shock protein Hsp15